MSELRLFGLVSALVLGGAVLWLQRRGRLRRLDMLLGLAGATALLTVSAYPPLVNGLAETFSASSRPLALAIVAIVILFAMGIYLLQRVDRLEIALGDLVRALARAEYHRSAGRLADRTRGIAVVIPAYNEAASLERLLPLLPAQLCGRPVHALVIVDGARDSTAAVARQFAAAVSVHPVNRGQGDALRTGFELALAEGAEIVVTMDADGQHRPEELERLVAPVVAGEADYVMGSRFLGQYEDQGGARHAGIVIFSAVLTALTGIRITDCTNGYRAIRATGLARLTLRENRFNAPELIMDAQAKGLRIREVPVTILTRQEGESKKPRTWRYPLGFALVIVRTWLRL